MVESAVALGLDAVTRVEEKSGEEALDDWRGEEGDDPSAASLLATRRFRRRDSS